MALIDSFSISPLQEFQVATYAALSGDFTTVVNPIGATLYPGYGPTSLFLYSTPFELVTSTADTAAGSLRQAITAADALTNNPTWIVFNIPTTDPGDRSGVWTISPASSLPEITAQVVVDGTTQPGFTGPADHCSERQRCRAVRIGPDVRRGRRRQHDPRVRDRRFRR